MFLSYLWDSKLGTPDTNCLYKPFSIKLFPKILCSGKGAIKSDTHFMEYQRSKKTGISLIRGVFLKNISIRHFIDLNLDIMSQIPFDLSPIVNSNLFLQKLSTC